ncbi:MAG: acylphosphatase [Gemmatimonadales bacterium]|nr:acylphosphatase [Nitrospirota bacterium]
MSQDDTAIRAYQWTVSGRVQGVGFRWFVLRAAKRSGVTGWVQNMWDGRVEVMGQGTVSSLHEFERELQNGPQLSIVEKVEKLEKTAEMGLFKSFEIK